MFILLISQLLSIDSAFHPLFVLDVWDTQTDQNPYWAPAGWLRWLEHLSAHQKVAG